MGNRKTELDSKWEKTGLRISVPRGSHGDSNLTDRWIGRFETFCIMVNTNYGLIMRIELGGNFTNVTDSFWQNYKHRKHINFWMIWNENLC